MRKINSSFQTEYISEEGQQLSNRDYFGYVEMDDYACYVLADSLDEDETINSARLVVESVIRNFVERPFMSRRGCKRLIKKAHGDLQHQIGSRNLKATLMLVVTDYQKIRYCHVGNSRFYLMRNDRFLIQTKDQSLTQNLIEEETIVLDQVAKHEERNNLYSYLGDQGNPKPIISKKMKLENGDVFSIFTRGVWEQCEETEFLQIQKEAKQPSDILEQVEDLILSKQEQGDIDNYTLAVTFVQKIYESPKKKLSIKKLLMIVIPIVLLLGGIGTGIYFYQKSVKEKEHKLQVYMESGEHYLSYDNYKKAAEEYTEAKKLAVDLKKEQEQEESDQYLKLAEQVLLADETMNAKEYEKAQELYLVAKQLSNEAGNIGMAYIEKQLQQTEGYLSIFDLLELGEKKENAGNLKKAIACYKEAREKASSLYDRESKEEALNKQAAAEEELEKKQQEREEEKAKKEEEEEEKKQKEEEEQKAQEEKEKQEEEEQRELEEQQKRNDQQNAIELENKGNELLKEEEYESAITYYKTARAIYIRLELADMADNLNEKIKVAKVGQKAKEKKESMVAKEEENSTTKEKKESTKTSETTSKE